MAAQHFIMFRSKLFDKIFHQNNPLFNVSRNTSIPPRKKPKVGSIKHRNLIQNTKDKLAARGFLRSQKAYDPPSNTSEVLKTIITKYINNRSPKEPFATVEEKFNVLKECFDSFQHAVPNSMLHTIQNPFDVYEFYQTPVSTTTPLDEFQRKDLPPNLHIQYEYLRFSPETDTLFNGLTAFPESSTIVTGLKEKRKYKGHKQKSPFYYDHWSDYVKY